MYNNVHLRFVAAFLAVSFVLTSCGKQAPVPVVDGYNKDRNYSYENAEDIAYNLQSEAILSSQDEQEYYVHGGDKLEQIAKHFGVGEDAILARNNLRSEADLPTGGYIVIPDVTYQAPASYRLTDKYRPVEQTESASSNVNVADIKEEAVPASGIVMTETVITSENAPQQKVQKKKINLMREHVLQPGENIFRLALKYRVSQFDIMAVNKISRPEDLRPGMVIKIPPAGERVDGREAYEYLAEEKTTTAEVPTKEEAQKRVVIPKKPKMQTNEKMAKSAPVETAVSKEQHFKNLAAQYKPKRTNAKGMIWPADGKLIKTFGQKGRGINHTGINIELKANAPIYAAENGTVLYSGDGLEVYGNLILIKHSGGLVTAYAYNSKNLVKRHQKVAKGDLIAFAGNSGNAEKPQLHFEVRKNTQPVDPQKYLPKR